MNRGNAFRPAGLAMTIIAALLLGLGISACGSSNSTPAVDPEVPANTNFTEVFIDGVRELTPDLSTMAVTDWDGWSADGNNQYSVLNKLFNPDSGWESVDGSVTKAESMLAMLEEILDTHGDQLNEEGSVEFEAEGLTFTATLTELTDDVQVPFFEVAQSGLTQQLVITSDDGSMKMMVAYDMDGDEKAMVGHEIRDMGDGTEYMVFRANFNEATQDLQIWLAGVADKDDSFKIQIVWKGNLEEETFTISQFTNAAKEDLGGGVWGDGFWKVMGGGSMAEEMAFRAHTNDNALADYFVVVTLDDITASDAPAGFPADSDTEIDSATHAVQGYIEEGNALCLDYLDGFPEVEDLNVWTY